MSGIAGLFYLDGRPVEQTEIERMTNILAHRGPDDAGIWPTAQLVWGTVCYGLRRNRSTRNFLLLTSVVIW